MLDATGGVNTHRGAIWALGLLVTGAAREPADLAPEGVAARAGRSRGCPIAMRPRSPATRASRRASTTTSAAREVRRKPAFRTSWTSALPELVRSRIRGDSETAARLNALLAVMASLDDTCVLARGGPGALAEMQDGARRVLEQGGAAALAGRRQLKALDRRLVELHVSPGGAADLLAAALFLDRLQAERNPSHCRTHRNTYGNHRPRIPGGRSPQQGRALAGVVASGDLEVLLEANAANRTVVNITTSVDGMGRVWNAVLERIFGDGSLPAAKLEINDSGATPGVVRMRIGQVFEQLNINRRSMTIMDTQQLLERQSFIELDARSRAKKLLDEGTFSELIDPFERVRSPWLALQGIVTQADDGMVVAKGNIDGQPAVVLAIDGGFQGGSMGEVSAAKIAGSLELAAEDNRNGIPTRAVILFETGGVRLQEANLGLAAIAEIHAGIVDLRRYQPVIGITAGPIGCYGGMSIAAGLCSYLIATREARLGLNGPTVIEQEAGIAEFDSRDRPMIWSFTGCEQRHQTGLVDVLRRRRRRRDPRGRHRALSRGASRGVPQRARRGFPDAAFRDRSARAGHAGTSGRHLRQGISVMSTQELSKRGAVWLDALTYSAPLQPGYPPSVRIVDARLGDHPARYHRRGARPGQPVSACAQRRGRSDRGMGSGAGGA